MPAERALACCCFQPPPSGLQEASEHIACSPRWRWVMGFWQQSDSGEISREWSIVTPVIPEPGSPDKWVPGTKHPAVKRGVGSPVLPSDGAKRRGRRKGKSPAPFQTGMEPVCPMNDLLTAQATGIRGAGDPVKGAQGCKKNAPQFLTGPVAKTKKRTALCGQRTQRSRPRAGGGPPPPRPPGRVGVPTSRVYCRRWGLARYRGVGAAIPACPGSEVAVGVERGAGAQLELPVSRRRRGQCRGQSPGQSRRRSRPRASPQRLRRGCVTRS